MRARFALGYHGRRETVSPYPGTHNLAFVFYNDMFRYVHTVRKIYPGGMLSSLRTPDGTLVAYGYFVPAAGASKA